MKTRKLRLLSALLALAMMLALLPTAAFAENSIVGSGNCGAEGDNVTWTLDDNGTLTIDGRGKMQDYTWETAPWYNQRDSIKQVVIENGVTNVGNYAFYNCTNMTSVSVSASVTEIGLSAFYDCRNLETVDLGGAANLQEIKAFAFSYSSKSRTGSPLLANYHSCQREKDWRFCFLWMCKFGKCHF